MNRSVIWTGEVPRTYDLLKGWRRTVEGNARTGMDTVGGDVNAGFGASPLLYLDSTGARAGITTGLSGSATKGLSAVANGFGYNGVAGTGFKLSLFDGTVYVLCETDNLGNIFNNGGTPTGYGDLAASTTVLALQCYVPLTNQLVIASAAPGSGSAYYLVYVTPTQADSTDSDDPNFSASGGTVANAAILPYYNSANPQTPLAGPSGTNPPTSQNTDRQPAGTIGVTASQATAGALACPSGSVPLYVVQIQSTDTVLNPTHIWPVGLGTAPAIGGSYTQAPFLRGLTEQHHLGVAGSAPQIDGASEWFPTGPVPNANKQIQQLGPGGLASFTALTGHLADAMAVGQLQTVPGMVAGGTTPGAPPTYAASSLLSFTSGSWPGGTTAANGTYATINLYAGTLKMFLCNFTITAGSSLSAGTIYTLLALTLPAGVAGGTPIFSCANVAGGAGATATVDFSTLPVPIAFYGCSGTGIVVQVLIVYQ